MRELQDFACFPTVSAQPRHAEAGQQCAVWLARHLRHIGLEHIQVIPTPRHPIVYADTSGVRRFDLLQQAVRRAGPHKFLFGSDGPWLHPGIELAKIRALGLSAADERLVLGGNLTRLLLAHKSRRRYAHHSL